ncbi:MAG TPA: urate hydroxylase PuuD, partial [Elusimicrobiota bacterium]|nr:urate hydroxylase PuuD [Elusimicrobiota bacterium]
MPLGTFHDWLNLALRWFHVVAAIAWIGQTYLFNWFEANLEPDKDDGPNIAGRLWMVHGGGFYLVEKQKAVALMPRTLHWFKWETMLTWLSGFLLLVSMYYAGHLMLDFESTLGERLAVAVSVGVLAAGYGAYRLVWRIFGESELPGAAVCLALLVGTAWGLGHVLTSRAVYLHLGAMMATIMTANVWLTILPNQRKMLAAVEGGGKADMR